MNLKLAGKPVIVRGGGDLATGTVYRLRRAGFPVIVLETACPLAVRRSVSVCEAVYEGRFEIEGMDCRLIGRAAEYDPKVVNVLVDPRGSVIDEVRPDIVIDAMMAKKNLGTNRSMAPITIALGPGFQAPDDVNFVIETKRGHYLGRVIERGGAIPDTKRPGDILGRTAERLLRAPAAGRLSTERKIGDMIGAGELVGDIAGQPIYAGTDGVIRGLIHPLAECSEGMKIGDIDPRSKREYCFSISEKSLAIAGGVMEAVMAAIGGAVSS